MTRQLGISDADLGELVDAAKERISLHGSPAARRALANAQMSIDTLIPDADELLGWTAATGAVAAVAAADRELGPSHDATVGYLVGAVAGQLDEFGLNPRDSRTGLGALAVLLIAGEIAGVRHRSGHLDLESYKAVAQLISLISIAVVRSAPSEVRG